MPETATATPTTPTPAITFAQPAPSHAPSTPAPGTGSSTPPASDTKVEVSTEKTSGAETPKDHEFEFSFEDGADPIKVDFSKEDETPTPDVAADSKKLTFSELKTALKDNPELLAKLKPVVGKLDSFEKLFKSPEEAKAHVDKLSTIATALNRTDASGRPLEPLAAIAAEQAEWSSTLNAIRTNDTAKIDEFIVRNPDLTNNLGKRFLGSWAQSDPKGYSNYFAKVIMRQVMNQDARGLSLLNRFNALWEVPEVVANQKAAQLLGEIGAEINRWSDVATDPVDSKPTIPKEITDREAAVKASERKLWVTKLDTQVSTVKSDYAAKAVKAILRGKDVGKDAMATYSKTALDEFNVLVKADPEFQANMKKYLDAGDDAKFLALLKSAGQRYMPLAAKAVWKKHNLGPQKDVVKQDAVNRGEPGAGAGSSAEPMVKYTGKFINGGPDPQAIDYPRMRSEFGPNGASERISNHQVYLFGKKALHFW